MDTLSAKKSVSKKQGAGPSASEPLETVGSLWNREAHLRTLIETIPDLVWLKNPEGVYLSCNRKFERFFGARESEIVGKTDFDFVDEELANLFRENDRAAVATGKPVVNEEEVVYADDGHRELLETIKTPMYDSGGKLVGVLGVARDITERKRVEQSLQLSEQRLQLTLDVSNIGIWDWNVKSDTWYASKIYYTMLGYEPVEGPSDREVWIERIHPDDRDSVHTKIRDILDYKVNEYQYEARMRHADGSFRWHRVIGHVIDRDSDGRPIRLIGLRIDITERKESELALEARRRGLEVLHRISEIALRDYELNTTLQDIVKEVEASIDFSIVTIELYHDARQEMEFVAASGLSQAGDWMFQHAPVDQVPCGAVARSGQAIVELHVMERSEAVFDVLKSLGVETFVCIPMSGGQKVLGTLSMAGTAEVSLDEHFMPLAGSLANFIASIIEYKRAGEEKNKLKGQLQQAQKMEAVGRLAGGVAHDFNNMLGVIIGQTELMQDQTDPTHPNFSALQEIRKAAESSADLTRQLLAFARKQVIAPKLIDLNEVVESMIKMLQRIIGEDIHLTWLPGKQLGRIMADSGQIEQILANLCVNARDAISGVGRVSIETRFTVFDDSYCSDHPEFIPGEYVRLSVTDSGCGMDDETMANIFDPFFTTKETGKGTGLGLATVYGIVKQNDGFINVYSEPGHGSTFTIYLPRRGEKGGPDPEKSSKAPIARGTETILLVEDNTAILRIGTMMLERQGYTVLTAASPGEAIRLSTEFKGPIDLLITDVIMPQMNGRNLAEKLKSHRPDIKRLFMSGYTADVIGDHGVLEKNIHFIQKPFSSRELAVKVRETLQSD